MADSDPISDTHTPRKRQKLDNGDSRSKAWDSQDDSGEDITSEDFQTVPTMPLSQHQVGKAPLRYTPAQLHSDIDSLTAGRLSQPQRTKHGRDPSLPSQTLTHVTQPTQALPPKQPIPQHSEVLVERSSPPLPPISSSPPPKAAPAPINRAPFAKPNRGSLLSNIAPLGTGFRAPVGVQKKPASVPVDSDDDSDPPVHHSSDENETQGLRSNLRPTDFKKSGGGIHTTPSQGYKTSSIRESPMTSSGGSGSGGTRNSTSLFARLMNDFGHQEPARTSGSILSNDLVSAYGGVSRAPRPQLQRTLVPARAEPVARYHKLEDVEDWSVRKKIEQMQSILAESVQRCYDALVRCRGNQADAMNWLAENEAPPAAVALDDTDELGSMSPPARRGVAVASQPQFKPLRPTAKQEIKAPSKTIAEKYGNNPSTWKPSQHNTERYDPNDDNVKQKRGRLIKGRRPARSPTPASSPPVKAPVRVKQRQTIIISDDESDSGVGRDVSEEQTAQGLEDQFETRLLKFFNECTVQDLADLSAQPEDVASFVLEKRPFESLDVVRTISNAPPTKSGQKSRSRPVGDKIVDVCMEMWQGYDAVDELVVECEKIAKPIQAALKGWGVGDGSGDGELHLMRLDEAHDSGIGTPASSCAPDDALAENKKRAKSRFLAQPENMGDVELKDYQLVGLNWLNLLWSKKLSCILADDMGLGKTCQVIAFLAHLQVQEVDGMHLVIVPGSTLENWLREFARFAPSLKVVPYYGDDKARPSLAAEIMDDYDIDVVVTTYDMTSKPADNKFLRSLKPCVVVYDEAHQLRNPTSKRYEALVRIGAEFKVLLTGTPLQNNLQELVAILAFIMPDLFAEKREQLDFIFKHKASTKDSGHAALLSAERTARARTMMTPFILRRKKAQVLDLPAKHSRVEWCDMTPTQQQHYDTIANEVQQQLAERAATGSKKRTTDSSNILMAARKAALHPLLSRRLFNDKKIDKIVEALLKHDEFAGNPADRVRNYLIGESSTGQNLKGGDYALHKFCSERPYLHKFMLKKDQWMDSGKVHKFKELVSAFAAKGDRVLVFSQFTTLMDILEAVLETLNIKFMRFDGSDRVNVRQDMIDKFTNDDSIPVFLLSTKAGGAGINLACANKVIIFDSGFNPQDDIQAENRAHRVGQTREVEVVRLVTRGTIEEPIHALGASKLALDERVAGEGHTEAEGKAVEKDGVQMVERMLLQQQQSPAARGIGDLKHAFKAEMEGAGVNIVSKQARY
ncbi:hypothetical protein M433DRAFT_156516 [Acidomyces richmondensis BFW]|nr:MAG: hypothetical protein FE78DRAFT_93325 [Acidomyces sp. 'richmondensis']KYG43611.1 hypothetical protein M433DRAFT_156516 [Acidomyces richmondensis BFW]